MRKVFLSAGFAAAALVLLLPLRHPITCEPKYNGVPLRALVLHGVRDHTTDDDLINSRLRSLDTNALPFLIHWIHYDPPMWRVRLARSVLRISRCHAAVELAKCFYSSTPHELAVGSLRAFSALGSNAAPAIPSLDTLMNDPSSPGGAFNALTALGDIGTNSLPPLIEAVRNPHHPLRFEAINVIMNLLAAPGTTVTPSLSNAISQAAPDVFTNGTLYFHHDRYRRLIPVTAPTSAVFHLFTRSGPAGAGSK